jgi:hypothetical protein
MLTSVCFHLCPSCPCVTKAEALPGRGNNGSSSDLSDEVFSDEPPPYDERPPSLAESSGLENQVGSYQWVTDSDGARTHIRTARACMCALRHVD